MLPDRRPLAPDDDAATRVATVAERHGRRPERLLQVLREVQETTCWLPRPLLARVAQTLALPFAHVEGVATAYRFLHTTPAPRWDVLVADNITDRMAGSEARTAELCAALGVRLDEVRADGHVRVSRTSCTGLCDQGPALLVNHRHVVTRLDAHRVADVAAHIAQDIPPTAWPAAWSTVEPSVGRTDRLLAEPSHDDAALGAALRSAVAREPALLLDELRAAGLRGRGGAGFPVAAKWQQCRDADADWRAIVCNADEGEPGTFKDRVLLARRAHALFDGMTIAAHVTGASRGFLYLRGEYHFLLDHLEAVLAHRRADRRLGRAILDVPGFDFDVEIHLGAGAYVCGEETALLESLEGRRGVPRVRPPFPAQHGYLGRPTVVNNVETFVAAAHVARHGAAAWRATGSRETGGTLLHSVSGDCARPGVYEWPGGTPVRDVLAACGARDVQAVIVGGPSGTLLLPHEFDRRLGFEDVRTAGAFMVLDETRDLVATVAHFARFFAHESCGLCTPCRVGTTLVANRLDGILRGRGTARDLTDLADLDALLRTASHCGLGLAATHLLRDLRQKCGPALHARLAHRDAEPAFDLAAALEPMT